MKDIVIFHLSKHFPPLTPIRPYLHCAETLYEQIKRGKKTIVVNGTEPQDLTPWLKVKRAWFVQGYPKGNLPRLEADITGVVYHPEVKEFPAHSQHLEIKFTNVKEVMSFSMRYAQKHNEELGKILDGQRARQAALFFTVPKGIPKKITNGYMKKRKQFVDESIERLRQKEKRNEQGR